MAITSQNFDASMLTPREKEEISTLQSTDQAAAQAKALEYANAKEAEKARIATVAQATPAANAPVATAPAPIAPTQTPTPAPNVTPAPKPAQTFFQEGKTYNFNPATGNYDVVAEGYKAPEAPVAPTPTKPVTTPTAKVEEKINYDVSTGRESQIQENLTKISRDNPALLTDRAAFDKAFGYSTADAGKKALLDSFYASKQPKADESNIYNALRAGQTIPKTIQASAEYQSAKVRAENFAKFSTYDAGKFTNALRAGTLLPGTQVYKDLYADPAVRPLLDTANKFNAIYGVDLTKVGEEKTQEIIGNNPNTAKAFEDGVVTQAEYAQMMNSDTINAKRTEVQKKKDEYDKAKAIYDNVEAEVDAELSGAGVTSSYRAALIANRRKSMIKDLEIKASEYNNATGTLNDMLTEQSKLVEMNLGMSKEDRAFARQKELATFQSDLELQQSQRAFEQKMAQQARIAKDPVLATQSVIDQYRQMGIIGDRSDAEIISSVQKDIASGMTLGESLTNLNKAYKSKPEYKAKFAPKQEFGFMNVGDGVIAVTDPTTGKVSYQSPVASSTIAANSIAKRGTENLQCGQLVNDYWQQVTGSRAGVGDTLASKKAAVEKIGESAQPVPGGIFVSNPLGNSVGHTGIVQSVNQDGSITVLEANAGGSANGEPPVVKTYTPSQMKNMSFSIAPKQISQALIQQEGTQYTDQQISDLAYVTELLEKTPTEGRKALKEMGYTDKDVANYKAGNVPLTEKQKVSSVGLIDDIKDLVSNYDWNDATGFHAGMPVIAGTDRADAIQKIQQLVAKMTLPNLGMLKGPMSDKDLAFIQAASSNLSTELSDSQFEQNLISAYNVAARRAGIAEAKTLEDIKKGSTPSVSIPNATGSEFDKYFTGAGSTATTSNLFSNY